MSRPCLLNNIEVISKIVEEYKLIDKPTFTGYCRMLKVSPNTLYTAMNKDDEIADKLIEGWSHLVEKWEERLWQDKGYVPAVFYLKTIRRFGYRWDDSNTSNEEGQQQETVKFSYEIVPTRKQDDSN